MRNCKPKIWMKLFTSIELFSSRGIWTGSIMFTSLSRRLRKGRSSIKIIIVSCIAIISPASASHFTWTTPQYKNKDRPTSTDNHFKSKERRGTSHRHKDRTPSTQTTESHPKNTFSSKRPKNFHHRTGRKNLNKSRKHLKSNLTRTNRLLRSKTPVIRALRLRDATSLIRSSRWGLKILSALPVEEDLLSPKSMQRISAKLVIRRLRRPWKTKKTWCSSTRGTHSWACLMGTTQAIIWTKVCTPSTLPPTIKGVTTVAVAAAAALEVSKAQWCSLKARGPTMVGRIL